MKHWGFFVGENATGRKSCQELAEDLVVLVKKHNAKLYISQEQTGLRTQTMKIYEVPNEGAINTIVSDIRDVVAGGNKYDGLVTLLGFEDSSPVLQALEHDLAVLSNIYSSDRR